MHEAIKNPKDPDHALGVDLLVDSIDGLNDPIAVIASETHPATSIRSNP